jgi:hypothetical protein
MSRQGRVTRLFNPNVMLFCPFWLYFKSHQHFQRHIGTFQIKQEGETSGATLCIISGTTALD